MFYEFLEKSTLKKGRSYWKVEITFLYLFHIFLLILYKFIADFSQDYHHCRRGHAGGICAILQSICCNKLENMY